MYRTATTNEYEAIKEEVKALLGNKASVRRERSTKRSYNTISIRPTAKATYNGYTNMWTDEETEALKVLLDIMSLTERNGFYDDIALNYRRGFNYLWTIEDVA